MVPVLEYSVPSSISYDPVPYPLKFDFKLKPDKSRNPGNPVTISSLFYVKIKY